MQFFFKLGSVRIPVNISFYESGVTKVILEIEDKKVEFSKDIKINSYKFDHIYFTTALNLEEVFTLKYTPFKFVHSNETTFLYEIDYSKLNIETIYFYF